MRAIIIAGGFGTRLRPLTYNIAKAMVPVVNVPFVLHQIELIKKYGINEIILNLHYLSDGLKKVFEDEKKHGIKVYTSMEESPLGTAGAVKNAEQHFDSDPLLIFNGDILTDMDLGKLIEFHKKKKATATITLTEVEDPTTYGLVLTDKDGKIEKFIEKPSWERVSGSTSYINAGIYVIDPKVFANVPKGKPYSFERELFPGLLKAKEAFYGYKSDAYWIDIGNPSKYMQAHRSVLEGEVKVQIPGKETSKRIWVGSSSKIDKQAKIFGPAVIGENCDIKPEVKIDSFTVIGNNVLVNNDSTIVNSIIWDDVIIGKEVRLKNCVIGKNCKIEDNTDIGGGVVLADNTVVSKGTKIGIKL